MKNTIPQKTNPFHSLAPTNEAENIEDYINALAWALENTKKEKIKNIAIAGPYGSGKSSVIQTFQKRNQNSKYHFLNISLATFKEEKAEEKNNIPNNDILRLIELSILQQLIYHEEDSKIPDSRFAKIRNHTVWNLAFITLGLVLFFISFMYLLFPNFFPEILLLEFSPKAHKALHYISLLITSAGLITLIYKSIRTLNGFVIKKVSIKNASIEVDPKISKSILNNYLDEILYFFEVTKYNVVILEDIDRFEQTEVFTKLREINSLINKSKKIKRDVVFIYAIRDDMFKDYDRTKFFDFMIPIIPVINSSNSGELLLNIIKENQFDISTDLLDDISFFIDDMRLLYNIVNEYYLYSNALDENLEQNKLLAMMVYKNIYPDDFTKLNNGHGVLFGILLKKRQYIQREIAQIDNRILSLQESLSLLDAIQIKDIKELRILYIAKLIEKINTSRQAFKSFRINNQEYFISQAIEDNIFHLFVEGSSTQYHNYANNQHAGINYSFAEIEKNVDPDHSYQEREKLITDRNNKESESIKTEIEKLEKRKDETRKQSLKNLLQNEQIEFDVKNQKQNQLISILLRNGYIDEDYLHYISIFYEGTLSRADYQFFINIKTQKPPEFDYKLYNTENLLAKIIPFEFEKEYILNYDLVDFLLSKNLHREKRQILFNQLSNETELPIRFVDGFIEHTKHIELFIKLLCEQWQSMWAFIEGKSNFSQEKKKRYFKLIIKHATVGDIKKIFLEFKPNISMMKDFLNIIDNTEKLKEIIKALDIEFTNVEETSPKQLIDFLYEENYYDINPKMLKLILKHKEAPVIDFETKNYSTLKSSNLEKLIDYVENNLNQYIQTTYLKLEFNLDEPLEYLLALLNNDEISLENKRKIVETTNTIVQDVSKIKDFEIIKYLLRQSKMSAEWENIISAYLQSENQLSNEIIAFLNNLGNVELLSKKKIKTGISDEETIKKLIASLLLSESISKESYSFLLKSIPYIYNRLDFTNLSLEKVSLLIENNILKTNNENFDSLKDNFGLHITLLENNPIKFSENLETFELDEEDLSAILKSNKISDEIKEKTIKSFDISIFSEEANLLAEVGNFLLESKKNTLDANSTKLILIHSNLSAHKKLELFIQNNDEFDADDIDEFMLALGKPYSAITKNFKRPLITDHEINRKLSSILKEKGYISSYKIEKRGLRISTFRPRN